MEVTISERQFDRKIGKYAGDLGLDLSNPAHRAQLRHLISQMVASPDRVGEGTLRGQGVIKFFVRGEDVVLTTASNKFVTILKGGIQNRAVERARGE